MEIVAFIIIGLIALDLLAYRYGTDSREGLDDAGRFRRGASRARQDVAFERELARELQQARQRRVGTNGTTKLVPPIPGLAARGTGRRPGSRETLGVTAVVPTSNHRRP